MKKSIILIFGFFFTASTLLGQIDPNTYLPNVSPVNPQAYQFMKYGEIPVNKYTGVPETSIAVHTIKTKAIDIPIALTYHSNGIKVNEEASWVGMGWNLNADMAIVQVVAGLDDFGNYKTRMQPDFACMISNQASGLSGSGVMSACNSFYLGYDTDWNANHPDCFVNPMFPAGLKDTEPDIYYFNMLGYSGKFALNWNTGQFICLTDKNIKIESDIDGLNNSDNGVPNSFSITTPDGNRFQFILKDETKINFSGTNSSIGGGMPITIDVIGQKTSRTYKIDNICTNRNDVVKFSYENVQTTVNGAVTNAVSKNFPYINIADKSYVATGTGSNDLPNTAGYLTSYTATEQTYSYLKDIKYNSEVVEFLTSGRIDLKEAKKLDQIIVKHNGVIIKSFNFNYDYFVSNNLGYNWDSYLNYNNYNVNKTEDEITKRLKLVSFNEFSEKPYLFDYNSQSLPRKTSYATDYWGQYNGYHTNNSFFPNIYSFNIERDNEQYFDLQNNNNSPVLQYSSASILKSITYPTGGKSTFEYELNSFSNYKVPQASQGVSKTINLTTVPSPTPNTQEALMIEGGNTIFTVTGMLSTQGCYPQYPEAHSNCYFKVTYFKKELIDYIRNNTSLNSSLTSYGLKYVLGLLDFLDGNPSNPTLYNQFKGDIFDGYPSNTYGITKTANVFTDEFINKRLNLKEGIVIFDVKGGCGTYSPTANNNWSQSTFNINYKEYKPLPTGDSFGAGLRIKSITSSESANSYAAYSFKKVYEYEGGKLMSPLLFFNKTPMNYSFDTIINYHNVNGNSESNPNTTLCESLLGNLDQEKEKRRKNYMSNQNDKNGNELFQSFRNYPAPIGSSSPYNCIPTIQTKYFTGVKNELHSGSYIQPSTSASGKYVGYDKVTEKYIDENTTSNTLDKGKEVSYYTNNPDVGSNWGSSGGGAFMDVNIPPVGVYPENGLLINQEAYTKTNQLKKTVQNQYTFNQETCFYGMKMIQTTKDVKYLPSIGYLQKSFYLMGVYPLKRGSTTLKRSIVKNFEQGNEILTQKDFEYDTHNQSSKVIETRSNGDVIEKTMQYPYDFPSELSGMLARNMITPVIETITKTNGNKISLTRTDYKYINTPNTNSYFQGSYVVDKIKQSKSGEYSDIEDIVLLHQYDIYSNPKEVSKKDGTRICYIWGYNNTYPIAKIENATSSQIIQYEANLQSISNTGTEADLIVALNSLRDNLTNAMVTTYTYKPLIGVSTVTDPKGNQTTYTYDSFNRLKEVKDHLGNVINEHNYNFRP